MESLLNLQNLAKDIEDIRKKFIYIFLNFIFILSYKDVFKKGDINNLFPILNYHRKAVGIYFFKFKYLGRDDKIVFSCDIIF